MIRPHYVLTVAGGTRFPDPELNSRPMRWEHALVPLGPLGEPREWGALDRCDGSEDGGDVLGPRRLPYPSCVLSLARPVPCAPLGLQREQGGTPDARQTASRWAFSGWSQ